MSLLGLQCPGPRTTTFELLGLVRDGGRARQRFLALTGKKRPAGDANRVMRQRASQPAGSAPAAEAIAYWRRRRLTAAGFEPRLAAELAVQPEIDLHELLTLLDRGCPPALAARILAPLDADVS